MKSFCLTSFLKSKLGIGNFSSKNCYFFFFTNCILWFSSQLVFKIFTCSIFSLKVWPIPNGCLTQISEQETRLILQEEVELNSKTIGQLKRWPYILSTPICCDGETADNWLYNNTRHYWTQTILLPATATNTVGMPSPSQCALVLNISSGPLWEDVTQFHMEFQNFHKPS